MRCTILEAKGSADSVSRSGTVCTKERGGYTRDSIKYITDERNDSLS